jgi:hypothetical protein
MVWRKIMGINRWLEKIRARCEELKSMSSNDLTRFDRLEACIAKALKSFDTGDEEFKDHCHAVMVRLAELEMILDVAIEV